MSSTILNLSARSPIDGTEFLVLATSGANWKAQLTGQQWVFADMEIGANHANFMIFSGAASLSAPQMVVSGADTDIGFSLTAKNNGSIALQTGNGNVVVIQPDGVGTTVNGLLIFGKSAGGGSPAILASGTDTNLNLILGGQGTGVIQLTSPNFTADGTVATVLGSLGPAGSHTTVQEWLTIQNGSGTTRYIPCF